MSTTPPIDLGSFSMSQFLAKRLMPKKKDETQFRRLMWRYGWMPVASLTFYAAATRMQVIQAERDHDAKIVFTYKEMKKSFPYTYQKRFRTWVSEDKKKNYWWKKYKPNYSMIERQYMFEEVD